MFGLFLHDLGKLYRDKHRQILTLEPDDFATGLTPEIWIAANTELSQQNVNTNRIGIRDTCACVPGACTCTCARALTYLCDHSFIYDIFQTTHTNPYTLHCVCVSATYLQVSSFFFLRLFRYLCLHLFSLSTLSRSGSMLLLVFASLLLLMLIVFLSLFGFFAFSLLIR